MSHGSSLLMLQFLDWIGRGNRTHVDVMDVWQSSCPRLSVWEDAMVDGYIAFAGDAKRSIVLTDRGRALLKNAELSRTIPLPAG